MPVVNNNKNGWQDAPKPYFLILTVVIAKIYQNHF